MTDPNLSPNYSNVPDSGIGLGPRRRRTKAEREARQRRKARMEWFRQRAFRRDLDDMFSSQDFNPATPDN